MIGGTITRRLLIIEDEEKVARRIVKGLVAERFAGDVAAEGDKELELVRTYNYDLIILDLMLLGLSGTEALCLVRRSLANYLAACERELKERGNAARCPVVIEISRGGNQPLTAVKKEKKG